ncbi:hypothetical protein F3W83_06355 [Micrococcus luteus]|nr:hypothetical protein [Micrococcus luteus]
MNKPEMAEAKSYIGRVTEYIKVYNGKSAEDRSEYLQGAIHNISESLQSVLDHLDRGYVDLIITELSRRLHSPSVHRDELRRLDDALLRAAEEVVRMGRSPFESFVYVQNELDGAKERYEERLVSAISELLKRPRRRFEVAVVLDRTRNINEDNIPSSLKFKTLHSRSKVTWISAAGEPQNLVLSEFCNRHWFPMGTPRRRKNIAPEALIKVIEVEAWDANDARLEALRAAEFLVDLVNSGSRTKSIGVKRKVVVYDPLRGHARENRGNQQSWNDAKPLKIRDPEPLARSLRFASRARHERSSSMSVLFYWISLENLYSEYSTAASRVMAVAPMAMARAGVRDVVTYSRQMVYSYDSFIVRSGSEERLADIIERSGEIKFTRMADWISQDPSLPDLVGIHKVPLYLKFRLNELARIARSKDALVQWSTEVSHRTSWMLERALHHRNQAVHSAQSDVNGERSLAVACREIVDAVFEVAALRLNGAAGDASEALDAFVDDMEILRQTWTRQESRQTFRSEVILGYVER